MSPDRFVHSVLLTGAALMAGLCGLCTAAVVGWTLPTILGRTSDATYAWMLLVPSLVIGGFGVLLGGALFHSGRSGPRKPDRIDVVGSALTVIGAGFYVLVFAGLAALSVSFVWVQASAPYDVDSEIVYALVWSVVFAVATIGCLRLVRGGWRRFLDARARLGNAQEKEAP